MIKITLRKILSLIVMLMVATSCYADMMPNEQKAINELLQDTKTRKFRESDFKDNDFSGCGFLIELGEWERLNNDPNIWDKNYSWINSRLDWMNHTGIYLNHHTSTPKIQSQTKLNKKRFVYIGPWQYDKVIGKEIRFFAYQDVDGANLGYQFETKTTKNSSIKERPFSLSGKYAPNGFKLCVVKWIANYGYNAIAENHRQLRPGFWNWLFRNHELVITGNIVQAEE